MISFYVLFSLSLICIARFLLISTLSQYMESMFACYRVLSSNEHCGVSVAVILHRRGGVLVVGGCL